MILIEEGYLNNRTVARIGEEVGIFRKPNENLREYAMRVIEELQVKPGDIQKLKRKFEMKIVDDLEK